MKRDDGFTLIEVLTTIALIGILTSMGALALRHFWLNRAVTGSTDSVITQLRAAQEKVVSESFPIVYGVRFDPGTDDWWVVRYDPQNAGSGDDTCVTVETHNFGTGVIIDAASFTVDSTITPFCKSKLSAPADNQFAFFYPSGNATAGSVTLEQTTIGKSATIGISAVTGRVAKQ